jgi:hypothetical protein
MRMAAISALMLGFCLVLPASARPLERELPPKHAACWERDYDAAHLKAHPGQLVASIRLVHLPDAVPPEPGGSYVQFYINLRQRNAVTGYDYQLGGFCRPNGKGLRCQPEWEAGSWRIDAGPGGTLDVRSDGIVANPNPYDAEEIADKAVKIPRKPDDMLWRLSPAKGPCELQ